MLMNLIGRRRALIKLGLAKPDNADDDFTTGALATGAGLAAMHGGRHGNVYANRISDAADLNMLNKFTNEEFAANVTASKRMHAAHEAKYGPHALYEPTDVAAGRTPVNSSDTYAHHSYKPGDTPYSVASGWHPAEVGHELGHAGITAEGGVINNGLRAANRFRDRATPLIRSGLFLTGATADTENRPDLVAAGSALSYLPLLSEEARASIRAMRSAKAVGLNPWTIGKQLLPSFGSYAAKALHHVGKDLLAYEGGRGLKYINDTVNPPRTYVSQGAE